jgi:hypothetical protein
MRKQTPLPPGAEVWEAAVNAYDQVVARRKRKRKRMSVSEAEAVLKKWLTARGWKQDYRATKDVWISRDGSQRVTFKRQNAVFEIGGRGRWERDYSVHKYLEGMSTIDYAHRIVEASRQLLEELEYERDPLEGPGG